jgi:membrane AbrB-like protein
VSRLPVATLASLGRTVATLAVGTAGGALAFLAALPAAWLMGATLAVTAATAVRLPTGVPPLLRNTAFVALGISLGAGVTRETLALAMRWPLSLVALAVSVFATMVASAVYLERVHRLDRATARLSSIPGALNYVLAYATGPFGDLRQVVIIQSIRVLALVAALPIVVDIGAEIAAPAPRAAIEDPLALLVILGGSLGCGFAFDRLKVPAAFLLGGVAVSAVLHLLDLMQGGLPLWIIVPAFVVTGSAIGARLQNVTWAELRACLGGGLAAVLIASLIAALFAVVVSLGLQLPFVQVWIAFAPGGLEAMAAMAIALGFDPAYVGTHHILRFIGLSIVVPIWMRGLRSD